MNLNLKTNKLFSLGLMCGCVIASSPIKAGEAQPVLKPCLDAYAQKDFKQAKQCYDKAAELGSAEAQYYLGQMYDRDQGVYQNFITAVSWYRKAADQNHAPAQNQLGVMYRDGKGVHLDLAEAVK